MPESKRAPIPKTRPEDRTTAGWQRVSSPTKEEIRAALAKDPYQTEAALGLADNELMLDAEERENTLSAFGMEDLSNETDTGELNKRIEHYEATDTDRNNNFLLKTGRGIDVLSAAAVDHRNHGETKGWYTPDSGVVTMNTNDEGTNAEGVTRKEARQKLTDEGKWRDGRVNTLVHESMHHAFSKIREGGIPAREGNVALDILAERVAPNFSVAVEHVILNSILQRDSIKNKQNVMAHTSPVTDYIANPSTVNEDHVRVFIKDRRETLKSNKITAGELQAINAFNGWRAESWKSKTMKGDEYIKGFLDQLVQSADVVEGLAQERLTELRAATLEKGSKRFAEGGMNTNMNDEMSSMMQEAPKVDPVSGNEVPIGSKPEEVRDDIPARLSEGEMVIPADVVKFFGVEYFMKLRDKAKKGFARMEEMGQMGNGDAASGPDELFSESGGESEEEDLPFTLEDFDVDEEGPVEANEGLYVDASNYNDILKDIFNNTNETDTDNTPTPDPTQAPDFDNTDVDGEDFQSYFKDNPGLSQANLVGGLGEGDTGLKNYNYLVKQLFGNQPELQTPIEEFYKRASSDEQEALTGYLETINKGLNGTGAASRTDERNADAGDTQTGGMSVSEMANNPSTANAASLSSFGALGDTALGRAALSAVDEMISATISPVGLAGRVGGRAAAAAASGLASIMGLDLSQVNNVATKQAFGAKQIGAQMAGFVSGLNAVDLANVTAYNNAVLSGVDVNGMAANGIGMVSFSDPATGQTTVGQSYGAVGNGMTAVATNDPYGSGVSWVNNKTAKVTPFSLNNINAAQKTNKSFDPFSFSLATGTTAGNTTVDNTGFGVGSLGVGMDIAANQPDIGPTNNSVNPDDISFDDLSYASKSDLANIGNYGNIDTPGLGAGLGAGQESIGGDNDGSNDGGDGNSAGQGDGAGTGSGGGTDAAGDPGEGDDGGGGADGGDGGTGDAGGTDGSEFKGGGFVKKRKKKKKQYAKGGLATRR